MLHVPTYLDKRQFDRILAKGGRSLEPDEYFQKWIPIIYKVSKGEYGYRQQCIREIRKHLPHIAPSTIDKNWGTNFENRPDYVPALLGLADKLNTIKQVFEDER